jgi:hypothetical protein
MNGIRFVKYGAVIAATMLLASTARVNAMSVNWGNAGSSVALTLNGNTTSVPTGDLIELGIFKDGISDATIESTLLTPQLAQSAFSTWGTGLMGDGSADGAFTESSGAPGAGYFLSNAFVIVFNASTAGAATQYAVIQGPTSASVGDNWVFPATDSAGAPSYDFDALLGGNVLIGKYHGDNSYSDTAAADWFGSGVDSIELASVPEPSTYMLVGMGLLGAWGLRRRRSK